MTLTEKLNEAGQQHKGTDLGALLQWAMLHIQSQDEALETANQECDTARTERDHLLKTLEKAKEAHRLMVEALRTDFLIQTYQTCAADRTSHINLMTAIGDPAYVKTRKPKKVAA